MPANEKYTIIRAETTDSLENCQAAKTNTKTSVSAHE